MEQIIVALVEDDSATRAALASAVAADASLCLAGTYSNGGEALSGLMARAPDVLLLDLGLPDMNGIDVIRAVRSRHPTVDVLVFTAFGDESSVVTALEAGAKGYLLKGTGIANIGIDVREIRAGGSPLSPQIARHLIKRLNSPATQGTIPNADDNSSTLTPRELEVLNAISRGYSYEETGRLLDVQTGTVHSHLKNVYRKLEVRSKTEAVFEASRLGLLK